METEAFIVVGPLRTGTSLVMGLLTKMGIWGGEDYRTGPNNPCYYENKTLFAWVQGKARPKDKGFLKSIQLSPSSMNPSSIQKLKSLNC